MSTEINQKLRLQNIKMPQSTSTWCSPITWMWQYGWRRVTSWGKSRCLIVSKKWLRALVSLWWSKSEANSGLTFVSTNCKVNSIDPVYWRWLICLIILISFTVKTNPPSNIRATSQKGSPNTLQINWTAPVPDFAMTLNYEIRFCAEGSSSWSNASTFMYHLKTCSLIAGFK